MDNYVWLVVDIDYIVGVYDAYDKAEIALDGYRHDNVREAFYAQVDIERLTVQ